MMFNGEPVLTFNMIDQAHGRQEGTAGHRFRENKQRFVEGKHYHRVAYGDAAALEAYGVNVPPRGLSLIHLTSCWNCLTSSSPLPPIMLHPLFIGCDRWSYESVHINSNSLYSDFSGYFRRLVRTTRSH
ncbi:hypothetical protein E6Q11_00520 [Candidatus Dojkabacteria bacterium]|uniref:KilA-N DNA-binding domain-containing protein n=1 Tax=Candidatus Dojkabacteria bacterium TaxID=2099670 RepID=A0A5C7JAV3_9BACT|nr:MAG: hypothetical protein E6Q11_00520 [Candidatus Dojkabacteria bacterium]